MRYHDKHYQLWGQLTSLIFIYLLSIQLSHAANPALTIKSESYNAKTKTLIVKTNLKGSLIGNLFLLHGECGVLSSMSIKNVVQTFNLPLASMG